MNVLRLLAAILVAQVSVAFAQNSNDLRTLNSSCTAGYAVENALSQKADSDEIKVEARRYFDNRVETHKLCVVVIRGNTSSVLVDAIYESSVNIRINSGKTGPSFLLVTL